MGALEVDGVEERTVDLGVEDGKKEEGDPAVASVEGGWGLACGGAAEGGG